MKRENTILEKSTEFAVRIVKLTCFLAERNCPKEIRSQLLRSGTIIGANVRESKNAQSDADFVHKLSVALKEADETQFWLEVLFKSELIQENAFISINEDLKEIIAMLTAIVKTMKIKTEKQ